MKTIQMVQGLCLVAVFAGPLQVWCLVEIPLTMFSDSVDDQYIDCSPGSLPKPEKLPMEEKYSETWKIANSHWLKISDTVGSFNSTYGTTIVAYTVGDELYRKFNNATREAGKSQDSYDRYAFKDFHFFLTKALQAKSKKCCYQVFRGIRNIHFTASDKAIVRFGQFASSSLNKTVAQDFSQDTFFSILTCHGVRIDDFSFKPSQEEVLIPPYEKFIVTGYSRSEKGVNITLESLGIFSHWNCGVRNNRFTSSLRGDKNYFKLGRNQLRGKNMCSAAARVFTATGMPFLLYCLLLTWTTLGSLGSF